LISLEEDGDESMQTVNITGCWIQGRIEHQALNLIGFTLKGRGDNKDPIIDKDA
ncbi:Hypothetical protein FKW44_003120, partial [Caligus rogercresseyi]